MKEFAALIQLISTSSKTNVKLAALNEYFSEAPDKDKIWVIALFSGRRPKRAVSTALLRQWCKEKIGIPDWLFEESYHTVGDLAETIALLLPENEAGKKEDAGHSLDFYMQSITALIKEGDEYKKTFVTLAWSEMNVKELFVFNKLLTGGFPRGCFSKNDSKCPGKKHRRSTRDYCPSPDW